MFLKKLWYYNKALFSFVTAFIIAMAIIMYKWGIVATPVLQFGMYSSKFYTSDK